SGRCPSSASTAGRGTSGSPPPSCPPPTGPNWRRCALADLLIRNARIRTMDLSAPRAEWLLVREGRVAALGLGQPPEAAEVIDAGGRLVLPGFQDAHVHLLSGG